MGIPSHFSLAPESRPRCLLVNGCSSNSSPSPAEFIDGLTGLLLDVLENGEHVSLKCVDFQCNGALWKPVGTTASKNKLDGLFRERQSAS
jgi:hypothetical protein